MKSPPPAYFLTFYARRALRIFPLYFAYLFVILVVVRFACIWISGFDGWGNVRPWWYLTFLANWEPGVGVNDRYLGHLWSLSIEEQFYFVWPAVVWILPPRKLAWWCLVLAAIAPVCRFMVGMQTEAAYRLTPCRIDALVLGAFVAIGLREFPRMCDRLAGTVFCSAFTGFLLVVSNLRVGYWNDVKMYTFGASLIDVSFACLVFAAASDINRGWVIDQFLKAPSLRIFGKYATPSILYTQLSSSAWSQRPQRFLVNTCPLKFCIASFC